VNNLES